MKFAVLLALATAAILATANALGPETGGTTDSQTNQPTKHLAEGQTCGSIDESGCEQYEECFYDPGKLYCHLVFVVRVTDLIF